jgi:hypothetical protein
VLAADLQGSLVSSHFDGFTSSGSVTTYLFEYSSNDVTNLAVTVGSPPLIPSAIKDDGDWGYLQRGVWTLGTGGYLGDMRSAPAGLGTKTATWNLALRPGTYDVYATWPPGANRATNAPYTIFDSGVRRATVQVNQKEAPNDGTFNGNTWEKLGTFDVTFNSLVLQVSDAANGVVVADAVLVVPHRGEGESATSAAIEHGADQSAGLLQILVSLDVNNDRVVSPIDALIVINAINSRETLAIGPAGLGGAASVDVNADGYVSPLDALLVINELNAVRTHRRPSSRVTDAYFTDLGSSEPEADALLADLRLQSSARGRMKRGAAANAVGISK